jgi:hypothetical protein
VKRRLLLVPVLVLIMLELTGQSGIFRVSTLDGKTIQNTPWQLAGARTTFAGDADISVECKPASANCAGMKEAIERKRPGSPLTVRFTLRASDPSWCYTPFYKGGDLSYEATADISLNGTSKRIGMRGYVEASGFGIESCGFVREFLVFLAGRDALRQLNDAANRGRELLWKCADGNLHGTQDDRDPCAPP